MDLPQFKEAAARLEAVQQQTAAVEREVAALERQRDALKGTGLVYTSWKDDLVGEPAICQRSHFRTGERRKRDNED